MKTITSSICGAALLAGLAGCATGPYAPIAERSPYGYGCALPCPRLTPEPCEITRTQEAARMRRLAYRRAELIGAAEAEIYTSTPAVPSGTGVSTFQPSSPRVFPQAGPQGYMGPGMIPPGPPLGPSPVAEGRGNGVGCPMAVPVPGKPGFVVSPHSPNSGYVDVTGMAPGSEARDPYSGKVFRVP